MRLARLNKLTLFFRTGGDPEYFPGGTLVTVEELANGVTRVRPLPPRAIYFRCERRWRNFTYVAPLEELAIATLMEEEDQ